MSATSDASYSEPPEVFDDETPGTKYVMVNTVVTKKTQDTTPSTDENVSYSLAEYCYGNRCKERGKAAGRLRKLNHVMIEGSEGVGVGWWGAREERLHISLIPLRSLMF